MVQTGKSVKREDLVNALRKSVDDTECVDIKACSEFIYVHVRRSSSSADSVVDIIVLIGCDIAQGELEGKNNWPRKPGVLHSSLYCPFDDLSRGSADVID